MDIAIMVQEDIEARAQLGEKKYGGRLEVGSRNNMISPLSNIGFLLSSDIFSAFAIT